MALVQIASYDHQKDETGIFRALPGDLRADRVRQGFIAGQARG
jgi:hypothetical protein